MLLGNEDINNPLVEYRISVPSEQSVIPIVPREWYGNNFPPWDSCKPLSLMVGTSLITSSAPRKHSPLTAVRTPTAKVQELSVGAPTRQNALQHFAANYRSRPNTDLSITDTDPEHVLTRYLRSTSFLFGPAGPIESPQQPCNLALSCRPERWFRPLLCHLCSHLRIGIQSLQSSDKLHRREHPRPLTRTVPNASIKQGCSKMLSPRSSESDVRRCSSVPRLFSMMAQNPQREPTQSSGADGRYSVPIPRRMLDRVKS
jgi:hypothetical protein